MLQDEQWALKNVTAVMDGKQHVEKHLANLEEKVEEEFLQETIKRG